MKQIYAEHWGGQADRILVFDSQFPLWEHKKVTPM